MYIYLLIGQSFCYKFGGWGGGGSTVMINMRTGDSVTMNWGIFENLAQSCIIN